jgi:hypothetical protein
MAARVWTWSSDSGLGPEAGSNDPVGSSEPLAYMSACLASQEELCSEELATVFR